MRPRGSPYVGPCVTAVIGTLRWVVHLDLFLVGGPARLCGLDLRRNLFVSPAPRHRAAGDSVLVEQWTI